MKTPRHIEGPPPNKGLNENTFALEGDTTSHTIGKLLTGAHGRDAIHIAVIQMKAAIKLSPGARVGVRPSEIGGQARLAGPSAEPIGIVDPFLLAPVKPGEAFWLFLYPNTITSLKHEWTHPAFPEPEPRSDSHVWVEAFAESIGQSYATLMRAADRWIRDEEYTSDNSEQYKDTGSDQWEAFWQHYTTITGRGAGMEDTRFAPFSCAC